MKDHIFLSLPGPIHTAILYISHGPAGPDHTCLHAKSLESCPTLWDPVVCSLPGSSVHGILQARVLGWVAIAFSKIGEQKLFSLVP